MFNQINSVNRDSRIQQVKDNAQTIQDGHKEVITVISDLKEEMAPLLKLAKDGSGSKEKKVGDQSIKNEDLFQKKESEKASDIHTVQKKEHIESTMTQKDQALATQSGELDKAIEALVAELMGKDEVEKKKKANKLRFEEKIERLSELEADFEDMNFLDAEDKEVAQKFFDNVGRFRNLKQRLKQCDIEEKRLGEQTPPAA